MQEGVCLCWGSKACFFWRCRDNMSPTDVPQTFVLGRFVPCPWMTCPLETSLGWHVPWTNDPWPLTDRDDLPKLLHIVFNIWVVPQHHLCTSTPVECTWTSTTYCQFNLNQNNYNIIPIYLHMYMHLRKVLKSAFLWQFGTKVQNVPVCREGFIFLPCNN
jgi:hypothetical protein